MELTTIERVVGSGYIGLIEVGLHKEQKTRVVDGLKM